MRHKATYGRTHALGLPKNTAIDKQFVSKKNAKVLHETGMSTSMDSGALLIGKTSLGTQRNTTTRRSTHALALSRNAKCLQKNAMWVNAVLPQRALPMF